MYQKSPYEAQVFVCTNQKEKGSCCQQKGAKEFRDLLKTEAFARYGKGVRINASGCMGRCEQGIVAAVYPQNIWLENLNSSDTEKIWNAIETALKGED